MDWTTAPESALLAIRFVTAGIVLGIMLGIVFARRRPVAGIRRPGVPARLIAMGLIDAFTLLLFFVAMRETSVAIGMFLVFMAPVWVAILAPLVFKVRTEPAVYVALAVAAGTVAGLGYAFFQMTVKSLTNRGVASHTIVIAESALGGAVVIVAGALVIVFGDKGELADLEELMLL